MVLTSSSGYNDSIREIARQIMKACTHKLNSMLALKVDVTNSVGHNIGKRMTEA